MIEYEFKKKLSFKIEELHKKAGTMYFMEPGDSDVNEGDFMARLWFVDEDMTWWLLCEYDVREGIKNEAQ